MGGAHSSQKGWTLGSQGAGMAAPHRKRSVGQPPTRWADDIKRVAGRRWIQAAQNLLYFLQKTSGGPVEEYRMI
ncbi:jg26685 [Pararge aegeria aegeria]|uniref:Jg26685 protein n=1 Tax=Pararge aegeria aegeria TaxID=348720 RepID=A0A8S4QJ92_9NEOP|nr:jg26685 [Pararge aegeria aegeria]